MPRTATANQAWLAHWVALLAYVLPPPTGSSDTGFRSLRGRLHPESCLQNVSIRALPDLDISFTKEPVSVITTQPLEVDGQCGGIEGGIPERTANEGNDGLDGVHTR